MSAPLILGDVSLLDGRRVDVLVRQGRVERILPVGSDLAGERLEGEGGCLLPALHDHHIHLFATAAAMNSLQCGPEHVASRDVLRQRLVLARPDASGWIRAVDFHPHRLGEIDRDWLDACVPDTPLRISHASGRLWYMNSAAMRQLGDGPWEMHQGKATGRLYDADAWLRERLPSLPPDLSSLSRQLAAHGVVGLTDTGPANGPAEAGLLSQAQGRDELLQQVQLMGDQSLHPMFRSAPQADADLFVGPQKFHLLESRLPCFETLGQLIRESHAIDRPVAFHCVSEVELVFALSALREHGSIPGDRIEHAGICPDELLEQIHELGLIVVSQPGFISTRGDRYRVEVARQDQPCLYRQQAFLRRGVGLAGSSDAPHGPLNPWQGMQAAADRQTAQGCVLGQDEALSPEQALALYTGSLREPATGRLLPQVGQAANLLLLPQAWAEVRGDLSAVRPRLTLRQGRMISGT